MRVVCLALGSTMLLVMGFAALAAVALGLVDRALAEGQPVIWGLPDDGP